jgi:hypothetical protein
LHQNAPKIAIALADALIAPAVEQPGHMSGIGMKSRAIRAAHPTGKRAEVTAAITISKPASPFIGSFQGFA